MSYKLCVLYLSIQHKVIMVAIIIDYNNSDYYNVNDTQLVSRKMREIQIFYGNSTLCAYFQFVAFSIDKIYLYIFLFFVRLWQTFIRPTVGKRLSQHQKMHTFYNRDCRYSQRQKPTLIFLKIMFCSVHFGHLVRLVIFTTDCRYLL